MKKIVLVITFLFLLSSHNATIAKEPVSVPGKDYRNSLKITFLSWISGSTKISYERAFSNIRWQGFSEPFPIRHVVRIGDDLMLACFGIVFIFTKCKKIV